ncbi:MAG: acetylxylan esterase [Planctomycetales bacterium]|nr:acetylxylan esterase [Planctomycetales bacterium]
MRFVEAQTKSATDPPPGTAGNAKNVPFIGGRDAHGNPVRLARRTGHVSNYDEALVPAYTLPDPLTMSDGRRVASVEQWAARRQEILSFYRQHIYGRVPERVPRVTWRVTETAEHAREGAAVAKTVLGRVGDAGPQWRLTLLVPKNAAAPAPVLLNLSFFDVSGPARRPKNDEPVFDPVAAVLANGWAYAHIRYGEIQPDRADQWRQGVIGQSLEDGQDRPADDEWGAIGAWAWGVSRVIDYLESDRDLDASKISLTGASRLGKTALWAAAQDERIACVFSVVPGEMGASLIRRDWGETLDDMAQNFPWQFAGNLQNWVGKWSELPVDQHMLISLIAPRPVYVNGGLSDQWSDPKGEFLAMVAAGPVYRLLGASDLGTSMLPGLDQPVIGKHLAFHYHSQGHRSVPEDWRLFLRFADQHYQTKR